MGVKHLQIKKWLFTALIGLFSLQFVQAELIGAEINYRIDDDSLYLEVHVFDDYSSPIEVKKKLILTDFSFNQEGLELNLRLKSKKDISPRCNSACTKFTTKYCSFKYTHVDLTYITAVSLDLISDMECQLEARWSHCCRIQSGTTPFSISALIDKCVEGQNNSPKFVNSPISIAKINQEFSQSWTAQDQDGDSLVYELIPSENSSKSNYEGYGKGLDADAPLYFAGYPQRNLDFPKGFHFDNRNGLLRFTPVYAQRAPIAVKITEFRDKRKIGHTIRDIEFSVERIKNNTPSISGINGGEKEEITGCLGQKICFSIETNDDDFHNKVDLNWKTNILGATISKSAKNGTDIHFCWTPTKSDVSDQSYYLWIKATDNSCEITGISEKLIKINVVKPFEANFKSVPNGCQALKLTASTGDKNEQNFNFEWRLNQETYSGTDLDVNFDKSGIYQVRLIATQKMTGCYDDFKTDVTVEPSPKSEIFGNNKICKGNTELFSATGDYKFSWLNSNEEELSTKKQLYYTATESENILVKIKDQNLCEIIKEVEIDVLHPKIEAFTDVKSICKSVTLEIQTTGSINATWSDEGFIEENNGIATYSLLRDEIITVSGEDNNGCFGTVSIPILVDQDCVWPGDINGDDNVNNFDVLSLGLSYGSSHSNSTDKPSMDWTPYQSENWPQSFSNSRNFKHADINSDGIIDYRDLLVIDQHYAQRVNHTSQTNKRLGNGIKLYFDFNVDSLKNKKIVEIDISLGSKDKPAKDVYGLAFSIDYNDLVKSSSIDFNIEDSWLTTGSSMLKLVKNQPSSSTIGGGKIEIALTRTNKTSASGHGKVGKVKFVVEDVIDWKKTAFIELLLESIQVIDKTGKTIDAVGESLSYELSSIILSQSDADISKASIGLFPNPTNTGRFSLSLPNDIAAETQMQIVDVTGKIIRKFQPVNAGLNSFDLGELKGYFLINIQNNSGLKSIPLLIQ